MSETPAPAPTREHTTRVTDATLLGLFAQKEALGFHTENSVSALILASVAVVPPEKLFEVLAKVRSYHRPARKGGLKK